MSLKKKECLKSKNKEWLEQRKSKNKKINKVRKFEPVKDNVIKRQSENLLEDELIKTTFFSMI